MMVSESVILIMLKNMQNDYVLGIVISRIVVQVSLSSLFVQWLMVVGRSRVRQIISVGMVIIVEVFSSMFGVIVFSGVMWLVSMLVSLFGMYRLKQLLQMQQNISDVYSVESLSFMWIFGLFSGVFVLVMCVVFLQVLWMLLGCQFSVCVEWVGCGGGYVWLGGLDVMVVDVVVWVYVE